VQTELKLAIQICKWGSLCPICTYRRTFSTFLSSFLFLDQCTISIICYIQRYSQADVNRRDSFFHFVSLSVILLLFLFEDDQATAVGRLSLRVDAIPSSTADKPRTAATDTYPDVHH